MNDWIFAAAVIAALGAHVYFEAREHVFGITCDHRTHPRLDRPWRWAIYRLDGHRLAGGNARWWVTAQIAARWKRAELEAQYERDHECHHHAARAARTHGGGR